MNQVTDYGNTYSVYMHVLPNGKRYIGMTRQEPSKRWHSGLGYRGKKSFYDDIVLYGWDNIQHIIVESGLDLESASAKEKELISQYHTQDKDFGYNTKEGGQTFGEHSDEFIQELHLRMLGNKYCVGRKISKKHIEALAKGRKGKAQKRIKGVFHHSKETKELISQKAKERWNDSEYRARAVLSHASMVGDKNPMYGKHHSDATKKKISAKAIGRIVSDETKRKLSERSTKKRKVFQCDLNGKVIAVHESCKKAAEVVGGNTTNITFACKHSGRTYRGFMWGYADDNS